MISFIILTQSTIEGMRQERGFNNPVINIHDLPNNLTNSVS